MVKEAMVSKGYSAHIGFYLKARGYQKNGVTLDHCNEGVVVGHYGPNPAECFHFLPKECRRLLLSFPPHRLNPKAQDGKSLNLTSKPVSMMRYLVQKFTSPGNMVLDLLAGLGPTSEACLLDNRSVIVIERDIEQMLFIQKRLSVDVMRLIEEARTKKEETIQQATDGSIGWIRSGMEWDASNTIKFKKFKTKQQDQGVDMDGDEEEEPTTDDVAHERGGEEEGGGRKGDNEAEDEESGDELQAE